MKMSKNSTGDMTGVSPILEIPITILHEIFFRLPIKSIFRCKSVCNAWRGVVSEPNFFESYAKYSKITLLLHISNSSRSNVLNSLEFYENGDFDWTRFNLKLPHWWNKYSPIRLYGICNGFLCFGLFKPGFDSSSTDGNRNNKIEHPVIFITNPVTGHSFQLPEDKWIFHDFANYFFGFDQLRNRFKVLRLLYIISPTSGCLMNTESAIFTIGVDDAWRNLSVSFTDLIDFTKLTVFNGAFYWIPHGDHPASLSTFNLAEEKLGQVSFPPDLVFDRTRILHLGVFSHQLYLIDNTARTQKILWTTKNNSIAESWNKIVALESWLPAGMQWYCLQPVAELQDGEILFKDDSINAKSYLISCNVKQQKCSKVYTGAAKDSGLYKIRPYSHCV